MAKRNDTSMIVNMRKSLGLDMYRGTEELEKLKQYCNLLAYRFDDQMCSKVGMADLLAHAVGVSWQEPGSCVFMLSGRNEAGYRLENESWLSPVAVEVVQSLLDTHRMMAFELCDRTSTLASSLSRLVFQLLEHNPGVVRKAQDWYMIESLIGSFESGDIRALSEVLLKIIDLQKEPVYIVLDRPDVSELDSPKTYASTLLELVGRTTGELKVLIVYRTEMWDLEKNRAGLVKKGTDPNLLRVLRMDQLRL
jgi:hypothetical protein